MPEQDLDVALGEALGRIDRLLVRSRGAIDAPLAPGELDPAELDALLQEAEGAGPIAFEAGGETGAAGRLCAAQRRFEALLRQVETDLSAFACVRTGPEDHPLLITTVGWGGDVVTLAAPVLSDAALAEHALSLRLDVARRARRLRILVTTATAAAKLGALLTGRGAGRWAGAIAYHFIYLILTKLRLPREI